MSNGITRIDCISWMYFDLNGWVKSVWNKDLLLCLWNDRGKKRGASMRQPGDSGKLNIVRTSRHIETP